MARATKNQFLKGVSGKVGNNFVIKNYDGDRIVVANKGKKRKKNSAKQEAHFTNFMYANKYASLALEAPAVRELYERRAKFTKGNAQNLMVRDFLLAPEIYAIELENYTGAAGEIIRIRAADDFKIVSLSVTISVNTKIIEKGEAQLRGKKGLWRYFTTVKNSHPARTVITALAMDIPQNKTTASLKCRNIVGEQSWILNPKDPKGLKRMKELHKGK
jgi:hypothetical protein